MCIDMCSHRGLFKDVPSQVGKFNHTKLVKEMKRWLTRAYW